MSPSLNDYLAARADDPAIRLLARTTAAMRADAHFVEREDDLAAAAFLDQESPSALAGDALDQVLARIEAADALDQRAGTRAVAGDPTLAEIAALLSPVREAALKALEHDRRPALRLSFGLLPAGRWTMGFGTDCELLYVDRAGHGRGRARP